MKIWELTVLLIILNVLVSCEYINEKAQSFSTLPESPPFVITRPVCEINERQGYYKYAGIWFNYLNTSSVAVDEVTVSFMLYDSKTSENPFIGSNRFAITKLDILPPNVNKEIYISLDQYIYIAPVNPYLVDFFYISKIHFTDGSSWEDKYGLFKTE